MHISYQVVLVEEVLEGNEDMIEKVQIDSLHRDLLSS